MTNNTTFNHYLDPQMEICDRENSAFVGMRVVVLSDTGTMKAVQLPAKREGRYSFISENEEDEFPLFIIGKDGQWQAVAEKGGYFKTSDKETCTRIVVCDKCLIELIIDGVEYAFFAENVVENGEIFLPYYIDTHSNLTIGRLDCCDICYPSSLISRNHAELQWKNNRWNIIDKQSQNGVFLNGRCVTEAPLALGDVIYIMGLIIVIGCEYICINNSSGRIKFPTGRIKPVLRNTDIPCIPYEAKKENAIFECSPRRKYKLSPEPIDIDMPPVSMSGSRLPLLLRMGNPILSGGRAIMTGNIFSVATSFFLPMLTQGFNEKDRREYENKRKEKYHEYLSAKLAEINAEITQEKMLLNETYPELNSALDFAFDKKRLWERRKIDEDFLQVRIGAGTIPMVAEKNYTKKRFELENDELVDEMYSLAETPAVIENAPIMLSLKNDFVTSITGDRKRTVELIRNIAAQLVLTHAYDEVKLVVLASKELEILDFIRYLPHNWDNRKTVRFFASSQSDAQQISKYVTGIWDSMLSEGNYLSKKNTNCDTAYVVLALDKELFDCIDIIKRVIRNEKYAGISVITAFGSAPKECKKLISLTDDNVIIDLPNPDVKDQIFTPDDCNLIKCEQSMSAIMQTKLMLGTQQYELPNMISFLDMYKAGRVEHLNPLKRWSDNNPVKSLAVPIGIGTDGKLFMLDLHEKRQGPHGLVAGMTGSGKSEFIITYILSMAVNFSPDEVAFILIDYKGGGLADAFVDKRRGIQLPHIVGTITNLDGSAIRRSLMSIKSELRRRQSIFKKAKSETNEGTMDIYDYQKLYRNKLVSEPMPHLFIISDEFAELKKQQPEFMDELISTARIGRSLGVHLILATQKPSGVVNDQIWSNTKFRVCLKVQDKNDSNEMLKRPEAAELKNTGRFYLQVGYNELFALGQSAWCGAGYTPEDTITTEIDETIRFVDNAGQTILETKPDRNRKKAESKQIVAIVQYLSDLAKREGIKAKSLWEDPLPDALEYSDLVEQYSLPANEICALAGLADDPENQRRLPIYINFNNMHNMLICGESGSGCSTLLSTLIYSLVSVHSPEELNYYILDMSSGALRPFAALPHCGAYLTEENEADFFRMLDLVRDIVSQRKKLFIEKNVTNFEDYCQIEKLPLVMIIIDGYSGIMNFRNGQDLHSGLYTNLREGIAYGIRFVFSITHLGDLHGRSRQEIDYRIALRAKDRYDYSEIIGARCTIEADDKPGRGICMAYGKPLEYHAASLFIKLPPQQRSEEIRRCIESIKEKYSGMSGARSLNMVSTQQTYKEFCDGIKTGRVPLGYYRKNMKPIVFPFRQLHSLSLYFGNPIGIRPVLDNLLYMATKNNMKVIFMRRLGDSVFEYSECGNMTVLPCSVEGMLALRDILTEEFVQRNIYRDEYCVANGIPKQEKNKAQKASEYIREKSEPILVIFESLGDICRQDKSDEKNDIEAIYHQFFTRSKGYNIYFAACFYPDDYETLQYAPLVKSYNPDQNVLLFGGRYDKQCAASNLPSEYRRIDKPERKYDRFVLKYRDEFYSMQMPCGELKKPAEDSDYAPII